MYCVPRGLDQFLYPDALQLFFPEKHVSYPLLIGLALNSKDSSGRKLVPVQECRTGPPQL